MQHKTCRKWDVFEVSMTGPSSGNPFVEQSIKATFNGKNEKVVCDGFYDGEGIYRVRFMPSFEGEYTYKIESSFGEEEGSFTVIEPGVNNHGPVRVCNRWHFAYEDGTPHYSLGTTCYVWTLQSEELQKQTLETLKNSSFNKIRFCIFPKHYDYNLHEPISYPYIGTPCDSSGITTDNFLQYNGNTKGNQWDYERFNVEHFRQIEKNIEKLRELGIEADLILFHPYDRWGFSMMTREQDAMYLKYVIARFAAFRNVWWAMANEYDIMSHKSIKDWEYLAQIICGKDPYNHLRSIHNCTKFYDHNRPWITHCSIQRVDLYKSGELVDEWREQYGKPVVLDEISYEGNIQHGWGNISGKEIVRRFWEAACRGGYAGHGETYMNPKNILWWSHGGKLHGESPERLGFLRKILEETPGYGLKRVQLGWDEVAAAPDTMTNNGDYYLIYYGFFRPSFREYYFNEDCEYEVEIIDTWEMAIRLAGTFKGKIHIELPGKEYMAVRIRKVIH